MNKKVNIVIPIYNISKRFLTECVDSVCNQTYANIRIILVDDGSNTECASLCDQIVSEKRRLHKEIIVIHQDNKGVSSARNTGIENAIGDYICFVDADDCVHSEYVNMLVSACEKTGADISECEYKEFCGSIDIEKASCNKSDTILIEKEEIFDHDCGAIWNKMFKLELLRDIRFDTNIFFCETTLFFNEVILKSPQIAFIDAVLYYYRINLSTASVKFSPEKYKQAIYVIDKVLTNPYVTSNLKYVENRKNVRELYRLKLMVALDSENNEICKKELAEERKKFVQNSSVIMVSNNKILKITALICNSRGGI